MNVLATKIRSSIAVVTAVVLLIACSPAAEHPHAFMGATMGTTYSVKYFGAKQNKLDALVKTRLDDLNAALSTYREDSEVSRFNAQQSTDWFPVSADTLSIVKAAGLISRQSNGAFDITVGPLVELWGFGAGGRTGEPPATTAINALLKHTGFELIEWRESPSAIRKLRPMVAIDLSAIAKGYAVDSVAQLLDRKGITAYLVEVGGEIRSRGMKAGGKPWQVAIEQPQDYSATGNRTVESVLPLTDMAIATSGDYRNYFDYQGQRYSHSINPQTGWPVKTAVGSVSVITDSAMLADGWATALLVLGSEEAITLANQLGLAVHIIERRDDTLAAVSSTAFQQLNSNE